MGVKGFPRTRITKRSCACDCGRGPVSVGAFFLRSFLFFSFLFFSFLFSSLLFSSLLFSSLLFSHPDSCLKTKIFVGKALFFGGPEEPRGGNNGK